MSNESKPWRNTRAWAGQYQEKTTLVDIRLINSLFSSKKEKKLNLAVIKLIALQAANNFITITK